MTIPASHPLGQNFSLATCRPGEYPPHLGSPSAAPSRGQHLAPGGIFCTYNDNVFHQCPPSQSGVVLELDLKAEKFKIAKTFEERQNLQVSFLEQVYFWSPCSTNAKF